MGREYELKYRADRAALAVLREEFEGFTAIRMETTYYDTPAGDLRKNRWTLRRRYENGMGVCTVKTPAHDGGRGEWEISCDEILAAIPGLVALGAPAELTRYAASGLEEVCAARFTRLALEVELPGAAAELALDEGAFLGGGREQLFAEVEVEHKAGSEALVAAWAAALAERYGLETEPKSKAQRALALAGRI